MPSQSTFNEADPQDNQSLPMSEDEVSDCYEECIQSEDKIVQETEAISQQAPGTVTPSSPVTPRAGSSISSNNDTDQPKSRTRIVLSQLTKFKE